MNNLSKLISLCKCSITININEHKSSYTNIENYVEEYKIEHEIEIINEIIKRNNIIELQVYPNTPNDFYHLIHYDIDIAIDLIIKYLTKKP